MRYQSPLGNLRDVLIQIQESANLYKKILIKNEAATRSVLIDPILRALGWNTANTNMVEVEKTLDSVRADYVLFDINQIPRIIVEAKSLNTDLNQKKLIMSLVNYAFNFGLEDVFLTDGLIWEHFDKFQPGNVEPSKTINLAKDDPVECAAYLVQHLDAAKYWPIEQTIDVLSQRIEELESTVSTMQKSLETLNHQNGINTTILKPSPKDELIFTPLSNLGEIAGKKPSHFKLPDGTIISIKLWKDILRECCKFVLKNNKNIHIPFPDRVGKKVSLISYEKPAKGLSYISEEYNEETIYIYTNYDSYNCVANALYILNLIPKDLFKCEPAIVLEK